MKQKWNFIIFCFILLAGCTTKFSITKKKITQNYRFYESLAVEKLSVKKPDSAGFPSEYNVVERYVANDLWALTNKETAELLTGESKERFNNFQERIDSFDRLNILEERPADTIRMESGVVIYTPAGLKRPVEYYRIQHRMYHMRYEIKRKTRKTIWFSKSNKWYRWYLPGKGDVKSNIVSFEPGQWYKTSFHCQYGFLTDGHCTLYFSFDSKGKISLKREDHKNEGPF
ncbi:MAG: hypothetical protein HOP10_00850 [Chitinophagaceae bacterium]|nr:hypothetical protein [Chitinophagaceae bacterium]